MLREICIARMIKILRRYDKSTAQMERKLFIYIVNRMLATEFFTTLKTRAALLSCQVSVGNLHI